MNPFPATNSVIMMDNSRVHHSDSILNMIVDRYVIRIDSIFTISTSSRGMKYVFLPLYSPDFNPIELAFSAIKAHLHRNGSLFRSVSMNAEETCDALYYLHEAVWSVTADDARGWYHHCNYIWTLSLKILMRIILDRQIGSSRSSSHRLIKRWLTLTQAVRTGPKCTAIKSRSMSRGTVCTFLSDSCLWHVAACISIKSEPRRMRFSNSITILVMDWSYGNGMCANLSNYFVEKILLTPTGHWIPTANASPPLDYPITASLIVSWGHAAYVLCWCEDSLHLWRPPFL